MAQLAEWPLLNAEIRGSNPTIANLFICDHLNESVCKLLGKYENIEKEAWNGLLKTSQL